MAELQLHLRRVAIQGCFLYLINTDRFYSFSHDIFTEYPVEGALWFLQKVDICISMLLRPLTRAVPIWSFIWSIVVTLLLSTTKIQPFFSSILYCGIRITSVLFRHSTIYGIFLVVQVRRLKRSDGWSPFDLDCAIYAVIEWI